MLMNLSIRRSSELCADNGHNLGFLSTKSVTDEYQPGMQKHRE